MNFTTYVGDSFHLVGSIKSRLDTSDPLDLDGCGITFTATGVAGIPPVNVTLTKTIGAGVTVTDEDNGIFAVDLTPDDTEELGLDGGTFSYSIRVTVDASHVHTVDVGQIKILPSL